MAKGDQIKALLEHLKKKEYDKALELIKKDNRLFKNALAAMTNDDIPYWGNLAVSLWKKEPHIAEPIYCRILELTPKDSLTHNNLGILLEYKGDFDGAEKEFRKAIELDPKYSAAHHGLGYLLDEKGDKEGAEKEYRKAIELDPKYSAAHYNLGLFLKNKGDTEGAEREYREAIELDPENLYARTNLGVLLKDKGDFEGAEKEWRKAIKLDPKDSYAHNNLGNFLDEKGDKEGAEKEYRKTIELDPKNSFAYNNLSNLLKDRGDLEGAEEELTKALKFADSLLPEDQMKVATNLANLLRDKGYFACKLSDCEATWDSVYQLKEFLRTVDIDPNLRKSLYAESYYLLGIAALQNNWPIPIWLKARTAIRDFKQAARLNPNDPRIWYNLGAVYHLLNKSNQTRHFVNTAIAIKKKSDEKYDLAEKLLETIDKAASSPRITWPRWIPLILSLAFWVVVALCGKSLFPNVMDGVLLTIMIVMLLASAVILLAPVLPYIKRIEVAKVGLQLDLGSPQKREYESLIETRQNIPSEPIDKPQQRQ